MTAQVFKSGFDYVALPKLFFYACLLYVNLFKWLSQEWLFVLAGIVLMSIWIGLLGDSKKILIDDGGVKYGSRLTWYLLSNSKYEFYVEFLNIYLIELHPQEKMQGRRLLITTNDNEVYAIAEGTFKDFDFFISLLKQHVSVQYIADKPKSAWAAMGKPYDTIVSVSLALAGLGIMLNEFAYDWHFNSISVLTFLVCICIPLCVVSIFIFPHGNKIKKALLNALFAGSFLGAGLAFLITGLNQLYTEYQGNIYVYQFELAEQNGYAQVWKAASDMGQDMQDFKVTRNFKHGFTIGVTQDFKPGHSYQISVKQGLLNDWAFAPDAFRNAQEVKAAPQPKNKVIDNEGD